MNSEKDRRESERFTLSLKAKFLLSGEREDVGTILDISECGVALITDADVKEREEIVIYADDLGRLPGFVARAFKGGFAVAFSLSDTQRSYIATRISSALNGRPYLRLAERRSHFRTRYKIETTAWLADKGQILDCMIVDMSRTGCRVRCAARPPVGTEAVIGTLRGVVRRHTLDGFGVEFASAKIHDHSPAEQSAERAA